MFAMPVVKYAVATSPHGIETASFAPVPKSIVRVRRPSGSVMIAPFLRTRAPS